MTKINPTYELKGDADLSKFLLGAIRDLRKNEIEVKRALAISKLANSYTKNEIMRCLKVKITKQSDSLDVGAEINKALMEKVDDEHLKAS